MVYPGRPVLEVLPQFRGTASNRQTPQQRDALLTFAREQYLAGRSLRQIAELSGRSQLSTTLENEAVLTVENKATGLSVLVCRVLCSDAG